MEAKILKQDGMKVHIHVKGIRLSTANALRRTLLSDLQAFAIEEVDFLQNTSPMFNEYIASRLGLIPFTYEESVAADAKITLSLNAEGPCMVYSRDLKSSDDKIRPFNENVPIMKLAAGQKLSFDATAVKGTAKQHAKFQCALASYAAVPELKKKGSASWDSVLKNMPSELVSKDGKIIDYTKADAIETLTNQVDDLEVDYKEGEFIFFIESYNNLTPMQHVENALKIIDEKLDQVFTEK